MSRLRTQDGFLGGLDALAFGALVLLTGTLLVVNAWSVVDTRMAVSAAAREAVRSIVDAPVEQLNDPGQGVDLQIRAIDRALVALEQHGKDVTTVQPGDLQFTMGRDRPRCAEVRVAVTYRAPAIALPFVGVFRDGIPVTIEHAERVDPFRNGLRGEADCG